MRYIYILLTLFVLAGCNGGGSSKPTGSGDINTPPPSPQTSDNDRPPAVPSIGD